MNAKSIKGKSTKAIKTALTQSMANGFQPNLSIAFFSKRQEIPTNYCLLDSKNIEVLGITPNGEFIYEDIKKVMAAVLHDLTKDSFYVIKKVINEGKKLKETKMTLADALITYSCSGRMLSFDPVMIQELNSINNVWNFPLDGMFSYSELGSATGRNL